MIPCPVCGSPHYYPLGTTVYVPRLTFRGMEAEADVETVWGYDIRSYGTLVIFKSGGQANINKVYATLEEVKEEVRRQSQSSGGEVEGTA